MNCNHQYYLDGIAGAWEYPDAEGCLEGEYYTYCLSEDCYGMCEYTGPCDCSGCESTLCCVNGVYSQRDKIEMDRDKTE